MIHISYTQFFHTKTGWMVDKNTVHVPWLLLAVSVSLVLVGRVILLFDILEVKLHASKARTSHKRINKPPCL